MKRFLLIVSLGIIAFTYIGCGGGPKPLSNEITDVPEWYLNVPSDPNYLFDVASAVSLDMQLAVDKATQQARARVGAQLEVKIEGLTKKFEQEVGADEEAELLSMFTQASKAVMSQTLQGSRVKEQKLQKEDKQYRSYILMELPWGDAQSALLAKMKAREHMWTRFQETKTFDELNSEVEKYEAYKEKQGL